MAIIPSTGVELVPEIGQVLQGAGGVVDINYAPSYFTENAKIDKWSKFKPTKYRNLIHVTGNETPKQWQADNGLCGFKDDSIVFNSAATLVEAYRVDGTFVYELPTGGTAYPLRIADFRGHNTNAKPPVWSFDRTGQIYANQPNSEVTFTILGRSNVDSESELTLQDILFNAESSLESCSFCVIIVEKPTGSIKLTKKGATLNSATSFRKDVVVTRSELQTPNSYIAYPAFVDPDGKNFIAVPIGHVEFQVLDSPDAEKLGWMEDTGKWSETGRGIIVQGQLAYTSSWEGQYVFIELEVDGKGDGKGMEVQLKKDSQSSDGKTFYMTYTREIMMGIETDQFRLRVGYGSGFGNNDYLKLNRVSPEDIII